MLTKRTHYQILGLSQDVSPAEIKRAYRRLAKEQHPDAQGVKAGSDAHEEANEVMMRLNEAYETLRDVDKRADYDRLIGLQRIRFASAAERAVFNSSDEDQQRAKFLRGVFHPARSAIGKLLSAYKKELHELSADPFDDGLMTKFQEYVDKLEAALRKASDSFMATPTPPSMVPAVQMMRYSIARAADGLEELRYFCGNYDHNHLTLAGSLFRIAADLSREALDLTKGI